MTLLSLYDSSLITFVSYRKYWEPSSQHHKFPAPLWLPALSFPIFRLRSGSQLPSFKFLAPAPLPARSGAGAEPRAELSREFFPALITDYTKTGLKDSAILFRAPLRQTYAPNAKLIRFLLSTSKYLVSSHFSTF